MRLKEFEIKLGFLTLKFEPREVEVAFEGFLSEMRTIVAILSEDQRTVLRRIMSAMADSLTVQDVFPKFQRGTPEHETLRRLREAQFIRPKGGGPWRAESQIEVKPFGRLMWDKVGEEQLFSGV